MKKIIIPRGYIWIRDAAFRFAKKYRARKLASGKVDTGRPYWQTEILDEAVTFLQVSLCNDDLKAFNFGDYGIDEIGCAFWSRDEAHDTIIMGRFSRSDGSDSHPFLKIEHYKSFEDTYSAGVNVAHHKAGDHQISCTPSSRSEQSQGKRGRKPELREKVKAEMRKVPPDKLRGMIGKEMAHKFGAGRTLCEDARKEVLSENNRA